jgi:hypothetical protein
VQTLQALKDLNWARVVMLPFIFGECANLKHPPYFYQRVIFRV